jgi:hypothetical protein
VARRSWGTLASAVGRLAGEQVSLSAVWSGAALGKGETLQYPCRFDAENFRITRTDLSRGRRTFVQRGQPMGLPKSGLQLSVYRDGREEG